MFFEIEKHFLRYIFYFKWSDIPILPIRLRKTALLGTEYLTVVIFV